MNDTLRDLITRAMYAELCRQADSDETFPPPSVSPAIGADEFSGIAHIDGEVNLAAAANAILATLDQAGYTIVKRDGWQTVGHLAPGTELKIRTTRRCRSALRINGAQCDLDEGHTGWHRHNGNGNGYTATWVNEPTEWLSDEPAATEEDQ